jgi:hypothetical protein
MSQMGHERRLRTACNSSAYLPIADVCADIAFRRYVPLADISRLVLFNPAGGRLDDEAALFDCPLRFVSTKQFIGVR